MKTLIDWLVATLFGVAFALVVFFNL